MIIDELHSIREREISYHSLLGKGGCSIREHIAYRLWGLALRMIIAVNKIKSCKRFHKLSFVIGKYNKRGSIVFIA